MNCSAFQKQISMLVDGALDEATAAALKVHVQRCSECQAFHDRVMNMNATLKSGAMASSQPVLATRIKATIAARRARQAERELIPAWSRVSLVAVVVLIALGLGNLAGQSLHEMVTHQRADIMLDQLIPGQNGWVSDAFVEMGGEESSR